MWTAIGAFVLSAIGVHLVRRWAAGLGVLDVPNARSSHRITTPRGGGIAIAFVTLLGSAAYAYANTEARPRVKAIIVCSLIVAVVSFAEDVRSLAWTFRLTVHFIASILLVVLVGAPTSIYIPMLGIVALGWFSVPVACLWLVGFTNVFNFMDGLDGVAGSQAAVQGLGWIVVGSLLGDPLLSFFGSLIVGSSLGFLVHNWAPARIFLGDVGSTFLGFILAATAITEGKYSPFVFPVAVVLAWPFLFDTAFTLARRLSRREDVFCAHRSHLYQRLHMVGRSHQRVALTYSALSALGLLLSVVLVTRPEAGSVLAAVLLPLSSLGLWQSVARREHTKRGEVQAPQLLTKVSAQPITTTVERADSEARLQKGQE